MMDDTTIAAMSSPPGVGGIALIRLSGKNAITICDKVFYSTKNKKLKSQSANTLHHGKIKDGDAIIDEVVVSIFKAPHSYTGEDTIEISCHGSLYIQQRILKLLYAKGARPAQPGEFTLRAFLHGKMDLSQAEAVADLIASSSKAAHQVAMHQIRGGISKEIKKLRDKLLEFISLIELELDFSEEDVEFADRNQLTELVKTIENVLHTLKESFSLGNAIKNGIPVAIVGDTNTGKSTLLNLLLKEDKAIVSEIEGTTRDFIEDIISIKGIHFRFIDTAGIRHTTDTIEKMGIERTFQKIDQARVVLLLTELKENINEIKKAIVKIQKHIKKTEKNLIVIVNKSDLYARENLEKASREIQSILGKQDNLLSMSAKNGENLHDLEELLVELIHAEKLKEEDILVTNARHYEALRNAHEAILRVQEGLNNQIPSDLLAMDIRETLHYLGEITGEITTDEILGNIFKNFCIGK